MIKRLILIILCAFLAGCASHIKITQIRPDGTTMIKEGPVNFFLAEKQQEAFRAMAELQRKGTFSQTVRFSPGMATTNNRLTKTISSDGLYRPPRGYKLVPDPNYTPVVAEPAIQPICDPSGCSHTGYRPVSSRFLSSDTQNISNSDPVLTVTSPNPYISQQLMKMADYSPYRQKSNAEIWQSIGGGLINGVVSLGRTFIPWYFGAQIAENLIDNMGHKVNTGGGDAVIGDGNSMSSYNISNNGNASPWSIPDGDRNSFSYSVENNPVINEGD